MAKKSKLVNANSLLELLGKESDLALYAKDLDLCLTYASDAYAVLCGAKSGAELIGKTDRDLLPHCLASEYARDERAVIANGRRQERITLFPDGRGIPVWSRVIRAPIRKSDGIVRGVTGVVRGFETMRAALQPYSGIAPAVESIQRNYWRPLRLQELAGEVDLSVRQFERRFKALFGLTPQQYLIRLRVFTACELLTRTAAPVAEVAERVGFSDNSGFTRHFSKVMGTTPLRYRRARQREQR